MTLLCGVMLVVGSASNGEAELQPGHSHAQHGNEKNVGFDSAQPKIDSVLSEAETQV